MISLALVSFQLEHVIEHYNNQPLSLENHCPYLYAAIVRCTTCTPLPLNYYFWDILIFKFHLLLSK